MKKIIIDDAFPFLKGRIPEGFSAEWIPTARIDSRTLTDASALMVSTRLKCNRTLLEGTAVEFIATGSAGFDHIDVEWCENNGIEVASAPGCNAPAVAQYVWASLLRMGFDPKRMTLGVVGKGNVGGIVTDWGRRMGARVMVCDPPRTDRGLRDEDYLPLEQLLPQVDAVTFHVPLTRTGRYATTELLDRKRTGLLRDGALVVNASRGGVVSEEALRDAVAGRGLRIAVDTWEGEPNVDPRTMQMADFATPHIAGYSLQGKQRAARMALEALGRHFNAAPDLSGLAPAYMAPEKVDADTILQSYDPAVDTRLLRERPDGLNAIRLEYPLRQETIF